MKRRFLVEMALREPSDYGLNNVLGVIADECSWGMYGLHFHGPYDKDIHNHHTVVGFPPGSFRLFVEVLAGADWPVKPYKIIGEDQSEGEGTVTDADTEAKSG